MRFGVVLGNDPTTVMQEARLMETRGLDTVWFPDVPLVGYGDPFACMALAASATERIRMGTFITPAGTRPPAMLVTHFATINRIAPGRVRIGYASGSFSRGLMTMGPLKMSQMRDELTIVRGLLDHRTAEVEGRSMRFYEWQRASLDLDNAMPLEIAAHGPRGAEIAGRVGDALITAGEVDAPRLGALHSAAREAARAAGRPTDFPFTAEVGPLCVFRPGETLESPRVVATVQPIISGHFAFFLMARMEPDQVDAGTRDAYATFLRWARESYGPDLDVQFRAICDRYLGRIPEHDRFITPATVASHTLTGPVEEVAERLRDIGRAGVTDIAVLRGLDRPFRANDELDQLTDLFERVG